MFCNETVFLLACTDKLALLPNIRRCFSSRYYLSSYCYRMWFYIKCVLNMQSCVETKVKIKRYI